MNRFNRFKLASGAVAVVALATVVAIGRTPPPVVAAMPEPEPFEAHWRDSSVPLALVTAALPAAAVLPKSVSTEKIPQAIVLPDPPQAKKEKRAETDVCARHQMRKVKIGRRGWKCR